jgi:AraC family transcriptional regulator
MIIQKLPTPALSLPRPPTGIFPDHTLFTEKIDHPYDYPQHTAGLGILAMLSGSGEYKVNGKKERLDRHSFLVINQGSRLSMHFREIDAQPLLLFFHTRLAERVLAERPATPADFSWLERPHPQKNDFRDRLEWLARLDNSCSSFGALKADSIIRGILEELTKQVFSAIRISGRLAVVKKSTRVELYKRLSITREWIIENHAAPITLEDMAKVATLNDQHFLRMFRECYGVTPHRFLVHTRLETARQMLLHTGEKIAAICRQTGFESFSSFSGLFSQRFGVPPSVFRRESQG